MLNRRAFIASGAAFAGAEAVATARTAEPGQPFRLKYAPHLGMFRHHAGEAPVDQISFMFDQGFRAMEDNGMRDRPGADQDRIARALSRLGMEMGVFVATADFQNVTFASNSTEVRQKLLADIRDSVETARRINAKWCTVVLGCCAQGVEWGYQTASVVENLRRCAELCEPSGLVMVLEPLNPFRDHPGQFLTTIPQAFEICRAVGSPSCKILDDLYHQQVTTGNLIPNLDRAWDEIAYIQVGDSPGRKEPTTGEINYRNIFRHLHSRGYGGLLGMEHGLSGSGLEGERALISAYRACDDF